MFLNRWIAAFCVLSILQPSPAWLPLTVTRVTRGSVHPGGAPPGAARRRLCRDANDDARSLRSAQLRASGEELGAGGGGRPDLSSMKQAFQGTMDSKLVMEFVTELRARKALLLSSLEVTGGVITDGIYTIMEELALVNPSSGCGAARDNGKSHYCAMLPGHWIAASTIVPDVPYMYGDGETKGGPSPQLGGDGPTCTLGELVSVISGKRINGGDGGGDAAAIDYDPDIPVRPLRARISALRNTVKDGEMPTVVIVAGFSPADEAKPIQKEEEEAAAAAAAAAAATAAAAGEGTQAEHVGSRAGAQAPTTTLENGAVRGRGQWGVKGGYNLSWDFETMNIDLGGDRILKAHGGGEGTEADAGGRDVYEFFLDQNMLILAWKDSPKKEDAIVFVRDEVPR